MEVVIKEVIKSRRLKLARRPTTEEEARFYAHLLKQRGVRSCSVNGDGTLEVTYNLLETRLPEIAEGLRKAGLALSGHWAHRFRRWWASYTEENELDNLTAPESPCCSNPKLKA